MDYYIGVPIKNNDGTIEKYQVIGDKERYMSWVEKVLQISGSKMDKIKWDGNKPCFFKTEYPLDLFESYEIFYKLKRITLHSHKFLFDNHWFDDNGRFNPNDSMLLCDNFGISIESFHKQICGYHKNYRVTKIHEFIDIGRYVRHDIKDFFDLDFDTFFKTYNVVKIFKNITNRIEVDKFDYLATYNSFQWLRILYRDKRMPSIVNIKKMIKDLTENKLEFGLRIFETFLKCQDITINLESNPFIGRPRFALIV